MTTEDDRQRAREHIAAIRAKLPPEAEPGAPMTAKYVATIEHQRDARDTVKPPIGEPS